MIPSVFIAQEGDPLAVGRGPRLRACFAPVGDAPEFFFVDFVDGFRVAGGSVGEIDEIAFEVFGLAVKDKMCVVDPGQSAVLAGFGDRDGFRVREFDRVDLARDIFGNAVDEFGTGIRRRFIVMNDFRAGDIGDGQTVGRPENAADAHVVVRGGCFGAIGEPANDQIA